MEIWEITDRVLERHGKLAKPTAVNCPYKNGYDVVCINGQLWELTYSDCAPPDQRQPGGACPYCTAKKCGPEDIANLDAYIGYQQRMAVWQAQGGPRPVLVLENVGGIDGDYIVFTLGGATCHGV